MSDETPAITGPFVQAATFCDQVIEGKDGVLSIIRAIDRIIRVAISVQPIPKEELPPIRVSTTMVVMLKSGTARGNHTLTVQAQKPSGIMSGNRTEVDVYFEGDDRGVNLLLPVEFDAEEGLYWFHISLNGRELTRVPLRVIAQRQLAPAPPGQPG